MAKPHPLVDLARRTIEAYVREGKEMGPPKELPPEMKNRAGVFVSLHKKGELRGCIGTLAPTEANIAREVIRNAIASSTQDPRFPPVRPEELKDLEISVDVLSEPERVQGLEALDPRVYGVIVQSGWKRGLLLPDLPGVDTPEYQVDIARRKAGIAQEEPHELFRFTVTRYH